MLQVTSSRGIIHYRNCFIINWVLVDFAFVARDGVKACHELRKERETVLSVLLAMFKRELLEELPSVIHVSLVFLQHSDS